MSYWESLNTANAVRRMGFKAYSALTCESLPQTWDGSDFESRDGEGDAGRGALMTTGERTVLLDALEDLRKAPPDKNCYTLPDGSCVGVDCMHDIAHNPDPRD